MKFISFKTKTYLCYRIIQFYSILFFIPVSAYSFIRYKLFWHPIKLDWYQKLSNTCDICFNEYLYPSEKYIYCSVIVTTIIIAILSIFLNVLYVIFMMIAIGSVFFNDIFRYAMFYKHHKNKFIMLDEIHKM